MPHILSTDVVKLTFGIAERGLVQNFINNGGDLPAVERFGYYCIRMEGQKRCLFNFLAERQNYADGIFRSVPHALDQPSDAL